MVRKVDPFGDVLSVGEVGRIPLATLALRQMGCSLEKTARLLRKRVEVCEETLRMLQRSRNPVVRKIVADGIPPEDAVPLRNDGARVRCALCEQIINWVPCIYCGLQSGQWGAADDNRVGKEPVAPDDPTTALPGTQRRMEVYAARFRRGEAIFHARDLVPGEV